MSLPPEAHAILRTMRTKLLHDAEGAKTWAVILETGDETMECLKRFATEHGLDSASLKAIGAFERAELAYFDWEQKDYIKIPVTEQTEVAALTGDIVTGTEGSPTVHIHVVLSRRDGSAVAGHLDMGVVRPTLEVVLTETPGHLRKELDPEVGLPLIKI